MSLVINHNMMAMNAARNLGLIYSRLARSTQRLSSGLRINSAGDDAAGLAIRELMRADILVINQGIRNAADGISMIQTAEGAMAVIDEKLTRMKELAEQAATGTYTTAQREIMDSEYQAMASEIDRIANATDFNQTKLLDGSLTGFHDGSGMKIHFGSGNDPSEDYYFIQIGDVRATEPTGLQIGGGATRDIWTVQTGLNSLSSAVTDRNNEYLSFWYNASASSAVGQTQGAAFSDAPSNLVGIYNAGSGGSLTNLVDLINLGTAARVQFDFASSAAAALIATSGAASAQTITIGDTNVVFYYHSAIAGDVAIDTSAAAAAGSAMAEVLANAFNGYNSANTFAVQVDADTVLFFAKNPGVAGNNIAFDEGVADADYSFTNIDTGTSGSSGNFSMGGLDWLNADTSYNSTDDNYYLRVAGADRGDDADIWILDIDTYLTNTGTWATDLDNLHDFTASAWTNGTDASGGGSWDGANILTQSNAQDALAALADAILSKDIIRANLGALQNRLENTMTVLGIQAENLQAAESRISDVDVAAEMTEFTRNNILAQAATAMLAQANNIAQLALQLLQ